MKIIGRTMRGYILEAAADEVAQCAGFSNSYDLHKELGISPDTSISIGTDVRVKETFRYLSRLKGAETDVKRSETHLRALADMLGAAMPTTIIPPDGDPL